MFDCFKLVLACAFFGCGAKFVKWRASSEQGLVCDHRCVASGRKGLSLSPSPSLGRKGGSAKLPASLSVIP